MKKRWVIAISGASGAVLGVRCLQILSKMDDVECHLILSDSAKMTLHDETDYKVDDLKQWADEIYRNSEVGAAPASGSFDCEGMLVIPCSIKTLSSIANCYSSELISRAADVCLKEGRKLLLAVRETPFHKGHLDLMHKAADHGAIIFPPIPAFYAKAKSMEEMIDQLVGRMLARMGFSNQLYPEWKGLGSINDT